MVFESQDHNVAKHLACIFGGSDWKHVKMAILSTYLDASGSENGPTLAVAGFLACADAWVEFEKQWLARLQKDNLAYFHTAEFNASQGEFKNGWRNHESRRVALITEIVAIIRHHVHRQFGAVVVNKEIENEFSKAELRQWHLCAYSLAGRTAAAQIRLWALADGQPIMPRLIFEDGDKGKEELRKRLLADLFPEPFFAPKKDRVRKDGFLEKAAVPLQAADLLAYEMFDPTRKIQKDGFIRRIKKTFEELRKIPGEVGIVKPEHLKYLRTGLLRS